MANFQAILGKDFKTRIFRYPGGHMSWQGLESTDQALAKEGVQWIDWNMLCGDAEPASVRPTTSESMMAYLDGSQNISLRVMLRLCLCTTLLVRSSQFRPSTNHRILQRPRLTPFGVLE